MSCANHKDAHSEETAMSPSKFSFVTRCPAFSCVRRRSSSTLSSAQRAPTSNDNASVTLSGHCHVGMYSDKYWVVVFTSQGPRATQCWSEQKGGNKGWPQKRRNLTICIDLSLDNLVPSRNDLGPAP